MASKPPTPEPPVTTDRPGWFGEPIGLDPMPPPPPPPPPPPAD